MFRRLRPSPSPRFMQAKKPSTCPETGKAIAVGDTIAWFPASAKAFHTDSKAASDLRSQQFADSWALADANY